MFHIMIVMYQRHHRYHTLRLSMYSDLRGHPGSSPVFVVVSPFCSFFFLFFCVVFLLFVSSLIFNLRNCFVCASCCQTHFVLCFCFVCFRLMSPMMSVTLVCPFFISHLIFTNVYLQGHRLPGC